MVTSQRLFISADTSVAAADTEVDGTDFTSAQLDTKHAILGSLTCYILGANAGSTGNVTFNFVQYDTLRESWDTVAYVSVICALNGVTAVQKSITFYPDMVKLKLLSITNADATYAATCNAVLTTKEKLS